MERQGHREKWMKRNQPRATDEMICVKRVYEPAARSDGKRFLVDRLWPRGVKKQTLRLDGWVKEAGPSDALRRWFNHEPAKWDEFQKRYRAELEEKPDALEPLLSAAASGGRVTLLFGARDVEHNNAQALKSYLSQRLKCAGRR